MAVRARFAWWMYGVFLSPGTGLSVPGLWLWAAGDGERGVSALVPGLVLLAFGLLYVRMPYFVLTPGRLRVPFVLHGGRAETAIGPREGPGPTVPSGTADEESAVTGRT